MRKLHISELNRLTTEEYKRADKLPLIVVLDNIRSCFNIGSVFRTSDAFLVKMLYLCGITATPPDKEIHKTALDAEKSVTWKYFRKTEEAINELRSRQYNIFAVEQVENSIPLSSFKRLPGEKTALIFGNEVRGVQQEIINMCDGAIEIPQYGTKHSFNVSVCAGIVIWDIFQKLKQT